jgi:hypothetical protein
MVKHTYVLTSMRYYILNYMKNEVSEFKLDILRSKTLKEEMWQQFNRKVA